MTHLQIKQGKSAGIGHGIFPSSMHWQAIDDLYERLIHHWPFHKSSAPLASDTDVNINVHVDISEDKQTYKLSAELPGLKIGNVKLDLSDGVLTLTGDKKFEREEDKNDYHLIERRYGSFKRSFVLPPSVEQEDIKANFNNGVLTITLPKSIKAQQDQRNISIES